jgi:hypothetical protein
MLSLAHDIAGAADPALFAERCGLTLDPWQADFMRSDASRVILNCARQTGKSTVVAVRALHTALYLPRSTTVIVSPTQIQSAEMLRTVRMLYGRLVEDEHGAELPAESVLKVEFRNRSRIRALPGSEKSIRGLAAHLVIFDEASRVPDDLYAAARPMVATTGGAIVMLSTPHGRRGSFFDLWHSGDPAWSRISVPASACPRISADFLAGERKELGEARFSEEYLLEFLDSETAAFSTAIIDAAFDDGVRPLWI